MLHTVEGAIQIQRKHLSPLLFRKFLQRDAGAASCVIDQNIHGAECIQNCLHRILYLRYVRHVASYRKTSDAQRFHLFCNLRQFLFPSCENGYIGSLTRQCQCELASQPYGRTRNYRNITCQIKHNLDLLIVSFFLLII